MMVSLGNLLLKHSDPKSIVDALKLCLGVNELDAARDFLKQLKVKIDEKSIVSSHQAYLLFCMTHHVYLRARAKKEYDKTEWVDCFSALINYMFDNKYPSNTTNTEESTVTAENEEPQFKEKHVATVRSIVDKLWKRAQVSKQVIETWAITISKGDGSDLLIGQYGSEKAEKINSNSNSNNNNSSSSSSTLELNKEKRSSSISSNTSNNNLKIKVDSTTTTSSSSSSSSSSIKKDKFNQKSDARIQQEYHYYRGCIALDKIISELKPPTHRNTVLSAFEVFHALCYMNKISSKNACIAAGAAILLSSKIHADTHGMLRLDRIVTAYVNAVSQDLILQDITTQPPDKDYIYDEMVKLEFEAVLSCNYDFSICAHPPAGSQGLLAELCGKLNASSKLVQEAMKYIQQVSYKYSQLCVLYSKVEICAAFIKLTKQNVKEITLASDWMETIGVSAVNVDVIVEKLKKYQQQKFPKLAKMLQAKRDEKNQVSLPVSGTSQSSPSADRLLQELDSSKQKRSRSNSFNNNNNGSGNRERTSSNDQASVPSWAKGTLPAGSIPSVTGSSASSFKVEVPLVAKPPTSTELKIEQQQKKQRFD